MKLLLALLLTAMPAWAEKKLWIWELDTKPEPVKKQEQALPPKVEPKPAPPAPPKAPHEAGNLAAEFENRDLREIKGSTKTVLPKKDLKSQLHSIRVGDQLMARINHSVIAFPDEKVPVIGVILGSDGREGAKLIGTSTLEKNSKRIFIEFNIVARAGKAYSFKGTALSGDGQTGFEGQYHSQEGKYFAGDFIASTVSAYFDGLVPRFRNVFGPESDTAPESAVKKGLAGGSLSSAERFREKLKKTPEFSELLGPIPIQVLILEKAVEL